MASSKVMSSTSPANPDLPRHSSTTTTPSTPIAKTKTKTKIKTTPSSSTTTTAAASILIQNSSSLLPHQPQEQSQIQAHHLHQSDQSFESMNMEEILKNIYSEPDSLSSAVDGGDLPAVSTVDGTDVGRSDVAGVVGGKTVDDVWKEIVTGGGGGGGGGGRSDQARMTLEDYLTKAGAVTEEDVRAPAPLPVPAAAGGGAGGYGVEAMMNAAVHFAPVVHMQNGQGAFGMESQLGEFGNGMMAAASAGPIRGAGGGGGGGSGRGKRRAPPVEEVVLDKATQQKQRRMIKNRESAARSRERKQAYTVELESLVTQLEEENARLLREEAEQNRKRFKQLMENLIPVVEKQRPPRVLRRVHSMSW